MIQNSTQPIFIVGLPRSGSTLWHNVFAKNSSICRMGEMHYLTPVRKDFRYFIKKYAGNMDSEENIRRLFDLLFSGQKLWGIPEGFWTFELHKIKGGSFKEKLIQRVIASDRSLESVFKIILEEYTALQGKERPCVKFPLYPTHIPDLLRWYPEARIIHITRDPRAMAISRKNDPGGTKKKIRKYPYLAGPIKLIMVLFVIFQYNWSSRLHRRYQKKLKHYELFRYEDLLANPEETIRRLCIHSGVEFIPEMLNPGKGQASSITEKKREGFDKSAAFRWKQHIGKLENRLITMLTRAAMRRYGYYPESYT